MDRERKKMCVVVAIVVVLGGMDGGMVRVRVCARNRRFLQPIQSQSLAG